MKQQKLIISPEYSNGILVDLTYEEIAQQQIDAQQEEVRKQTEEQAEQAKADAKASALAKLTALGLTEEEVKSIL